MDLRVYQSPKRLQSSLLIAPRSVCRFRKPPSVSSSSSLRHLNDSNDALSFRLVHRFAFLGSKVLRPERVKRTCAAHNGECFDEGDGRVMEVIHEVSEKIQNTGQPHGSEKSSIEQFWTTKHDVLEPSVLGIEPEPPSWPEREIMLRAYFERKVSCLGIPFSIRMIQKKVQKQKNLKEVNECTHCSVKAAFSSTVFIIHELQNYALQIMETLYCCEDLQGPVRKTHSDMDASLVWLFQKILWKTPNLTVYTMVLLANFSALSMNNNTALTATPLITEVQMLTDNKREEGSEVNADTVSEKILWNSMLEEAHRLQQEQRSEALDNEAMKMLVAPVSVKLEGDAYEEYKRTELYYKEHINQSPQSSLLLSNYAQFLYLVYHDVDKAEEYFRRAVMVEPRDAEALCRYADLLWLVRKDLKEAEARYLEAMEVDDSNHYKSKYATFTWGISEEGTRSTSSENSNSFDSVL
ncbi:hypothetical protein QN277_015789 [Acacia crassicarpa]|uniref:Uncharacterized protein n=1 Tax=Acacia crassicarpa TaxID=499986 RepID=A0AAE1K1D3_9FABA|nr:hypothetical protein QN277_015789 [Acacia crassicarpa]